MCELLAPAGSLEKLKVAVRYGADAVYLGEKRFSLRAKADNFSRDQIVQAVEYCRSRNVKTYVTVNIFPRNRDLSEIREFLGFLSEISPSGIIVSDPGIISMSMEIAPELSIHISTQANVTNVEAARFWQSQGASRINLARELGRDEIREIRQGLSCELEVFVHGALCISWSGRCLLSLYMTGRDANQGACAHPCRYGYQLLEEKRPGELFPVEEDSRGTYIFSSRDLCLIRRIGELHAMGVDALKIEGRTKGLLYLSTVVRAYRAAMDSVKEMVNVGKCAEWQPSPRVISELELAGARGYTENFYLHSPGDGDMCYSGLNVRQEYLPAALSISSGTAPEVVALHQLRPGDVVEYMDSALNNPLLSIKRILDENGTALSRTLGGERVVLEFDQEIETESYSMFRRKNPFQREQEKSIF